MKQDTRQGSKQSASSQEGATRAEARASVSSSARTASQAARTSSRITARASAKRAAKKLRRISLALFSVLVLALVGIVIYLTIPAPSQEVRASTSFDESINARIIDTPQPEVDPVIRVSFAAVGDNLIHSQLYNSGRNADGTLNYDHLYARIAPYIQAVDVAFANQETVCGGVELGLSGYPSFNSPLEILDALYKAGFDWINTASNHIMDRGERGILNQLNRISTLPGMVQTGSYASQSDADTPTVIEVNGLRIGLASYTYGLNGYVLPAGKEYLVNLIDTDKIARDYAKLKEVSDVQVVNMHWGDEYWNTPNQEQKNLAQFLANLGYSVVIGEHPHVIQPTTMLTGSGGNQTLVIYSLGNFISSQDEAARMLGEMACWTLCYDSETGMVSFEDVKIWPLVTHYLSDMTVYETYTLVDYTNELADIHAMKYRGLTREFLVNLAREVFGDEFTVIYEKP